MNEAAANKKGAAQKLRQGGAARIRGLVLGLVFFAAGIALSAWWFSRAASTAPAEPKNPGPPPLSDATKAILRRLRSPVEIRFYSLLAPSGVDDQERDFSGRVDQLLSQYQQEGAGKITVIRFDSTSNGAVKAAETDGIKSFNLDKGDACFLGIAVVRGSHQQSLASLAPQWEQALEPDLSRAIDNLNVADAASQPAPKPDATALEAVKRAIPNLDTVSVEEGSKLLRVAALAQFQETAREMQAKVKQAEERFLQAQNNSSQAEQEAALKDLRQIQKEQTEKLEEIALESKAQLEALQALKGAVR